MASNGHNTIFLTGAPLPSALDWEENSLQKALLPCFTDKRHDQVIPTPQLVAPSWRSLSLEKTHLPTGLTPASLPKWTTSEANSRAEASFLTATDLSIISTEKDDHGSLPRSSLSDTEESLSQYYEHSFAIHDVPPSNIIGSMMSDSSSADESNETSTENATSTDGHLVHKRLCSTHLSNVKEIPNARYLDSITPQTMTVDLVIGIISISEPREITTRRGQQTVELVEMLVGDDTQAGFGINVWLPPPYTSDSKKPNSNKAVGDKIRSECSRLRPQDIVLARNIALGSFRGNVYGQSLRGGMTTLDLLYRNVVDRYDERGAYRARDLDQAADSHVAKVEQVRNWVMRFVGAKKVDANAKVSTVAHLSSLPLDTQ